MGKTISTTIRIPEELKQNLELIANKESRSLNNMINIILQSYVNNHLRVEPTPEPKPENPPKRRPTIDDDDYIPPFLLGEDE